MSLLFPILVVDEVWKKQTLLQLLQIIELPILDCILTSPKRVQPQACKAPLANQDLVISNTCLQRELPDTLNLVQSVYCIILHTNPDYELHYMRQRLYMYPYVFLHHHIDCKEIFFFMPIFTLRSDAWLLAAADCLELFPDQLIVVVGEKLSEQNGVDSSEDGSAEQMESQKRLLFDTIAKYYNEQEKAPLISGRYLDIHAAILNLLGKK